MGRKNRSKRPESRLLEKKEQALKLIRWASGKGTDSAMEWAFNEIRKRHGLDRDLQPISMASRQREVRELEAELNSYKHTPNTTFWKKR